MKFGILSQWYSPETGGGAVPGVLAKSLAKRGHEVQVVTGFPNYPTGHIAPGYRIERRLDEHDGPGVSVRRVALYPNHSAAISKRFLNYTSFALSASASGLGKLRDVDAIWVYNSPVTVGLPSTLAGAFGGPPHLMHVMDLWPDSILFSELMGGRGYAAFAPILEAWCELTYRKASAIACTTQGTMNLLMERGVPEHKLHYIPVWIDEDIYAPRPYDRELAEDLRVHDRFTVLYAGSLGGAQGLDNLLSVCKRLKDVDHLQFLIVGSGVLASHLREKALSLQLDNVRFLGQWPSTDMGRLLSISDLNLVSLNKNHPLAQITLPSKLPAILAAGRAVIAWADGEVARVVDESGAGYIVDPANAPGLETAIRAAVNSGKASMASLGAKGRAYYEAHLSLQNSVDAVEALLKAMAERRTRPDRSIRHGSLST